MAAALRQSRTLTVSLVGEVSRGTPVYPPGLGYGSGPEGAPVRAEAPGPPSAYRSLPDPRLGYPIPYTQTDGVCEEPTGLEWLL